MQPEIPIAARQRVATLAVTVEPRRTRDDDFPTRKLGVENPVHEVSPAGVLVNLIEDQERLIRREFYPS